MRQGGGAMWVIGLNLVIHSNLVIHHNSDAISWSWSHSWLLSISYFQSHLAVLVSRKIYIVLQYFLPREICSSCSFNRGARFLMPMALPECFPPGSFNPFPEASVHIKWQTWTPAFLALFFSHLPIFSSDQFASAEVHFWYIYDYLEMMFVL